MPNTNKNGNTTVETKQKSKGGFIKKAAIGAVAVAAVVGIALGAKKVFGSKSEESAEF